MGGICGDRTRDLTVLSHKDLCDNATTWGWNMNGAPGAVLVWRKMSVCTYANGTVHRQAMLSLECCTSFIIPRVYLQRIVTSSRYHCLLIGINIHWLLSSSWCKPVVPFLVNVPVGRPITFTALTAAGRNHLRQTWRMPTNDSSLLKGLTYIL